MDMEEFEKLSSEEKIKEVMERFEQLDDEEMEDILSKLKEEGLM